jgi:two-component system OmpR family response regulator
LKEDVVATVLVVDDDPNIRSVVSRGLRFEGYDVRLAADGSEALRMARAVPPDVVVLDVMLPDMDGLEGMGRPGPHHAISPRVLSRLTRR